MSIVSSLVRVRTTAATPDTWVGITIPAGAKNALLSLDLTSAFFRVSPNNTEPAASAGTYVGATGGFLVEGTALVPITVYVSVSAATTIVLVYTVVPPRYTLVPLTVPVTGEVPRPGPEDPAQDLVRIAAAASATLSTDPMDLQTPMVLVGLWVGVYPGTTGWTLTATAFSVRGGAALLLAPVVITTQQGVMSLTDTPIVTFPSIVDLAVSVAGTAGQTMIANVYAMFRSYED